jgi:hypothetical protein
MELEDLHLSGVMVDIGRFLRLAKDHDSSGTLLLNQKDRGPDGPQFSYFWLTSSHKLALYHLELGRACHLLRLRGS